MFDPDNPLPITDPAQMQFRRPNYTNPDGIKAIRKVMVKKTVSSVYDKGLRVVQADGTTKITPYTLDATSSNADFTIGPVPQEPHARGLKRMATSTLGGRPVPQKKMLW